MLRAALNSLDSIAALGPASAPLAAAVVLRQRPELAVLAAAIGAGVLLRLGLRARIGLGTLGIAAALSLRIGVAATAMALALAALTAALLAIVGVEDVLRRLPPRARSVVASGLIVAGLAVIVRVLVDDLGGPSVRLVEDVLHPGDVIALALAMSFESAAVRRSPSSAANPAHFLSAVTLLPIVFERGRRLRPEAVALAVAATACAMLFAPRSVATAGALGAIAVAAAFELYRHARRCRVVDIALIAFLGLTLITKSPSSAVLVAAAIGLGLSLRTSPDSNADPNPTT